MEESDSGAKDAGADHAAVADQPVSVDYWVTKITEQVGKSAKSLVVLGQLFIDAKLALKHGEWEQLFQPGRLRFSIRTAQKLMQVANNVAIAKAKNSALLPPSLDSLTTLARLDPEVVQAGIDDGVIVPDMSIGEVKKFVLDQQPAKAEKPFVYDASLKALLKKVGQAMDKVPADQRQKFSTEFVKAISGSTAVA